MRNYSTILIIALFFTSCKDDEVLPLTPDLVTGVKVYDLDNNGNSSDIRVDFIVANNINVIEYRVMVIPSSSSSSFTVSLASGIPESNYLEVNPESFKTSYSVNRLPSSLLDATGNPIVNNLEYVAAVFVFSSGNRQLSEFSAPFTLRDQNIYIGEYQGVRVSEVTVRTPTPGNTCVPFEGQTVNITITINENEGLYSSFIPDSFTEDRLLSFTITNNILSNVSFTQTGGCYLGGCGICSGSCDVIYPGQGTFDEVTLVLSYSGDDCVGTVEVMLFLTRQQN